MTFLQVFRREIKQVFIKDPKRAFFLFGASAAYVILFGLLYGPAVVNSVPMVVYDQDQTQMSRSLVQAFEDSERYRIVAHVTTQEEMEQYLKEKTAYVAISVPPNFDRDVKLGKASQILVEANGINVVIANAVMSSAQELMMEYTASIGKGLVETIGELPDPSLNRVAPIQFRLRVLHNPALSYSDFFVLGVAMAALQQGILLSVGASMTKEQFGRLRGTRIMTVLSGKLLPYFFGGIIAYVLALAISSKLFDIPAKSSIVPLLALGAAFSFTVVVMGSLMAVLCKGEVGFTQLSLSYTVPAFIYSGYTWPLHSMDAFSRGVASLFPMTYMADNVRDLMVAGHAPMLLSSIMILLAAGVAMLALVVVIYDRKIKAGTDELASAASEA